MFKSKKIFILAFIVIFIIFYWFFYRPSIPLASIQAENQKVVLQAKEYDFSAYGKSVTKNIKFKDVNELNSDLLKEPEITVHPKQKFTYKNSACKTYTEVGFYSVDQNKVIPHVEMEATQSIEQPGHYILQYTTEFDVGKLASYYLKVHVVK